MWPNSPPDDCVPVNSSPRKHHAHADTMRKQDRDEIVPVAFRIMRAKRQRDHVAVVFDRHRNAGRGLQHLAERDVGLTA